MRLVHDPLEMQGICLDRQRQSGVVGIVPTMGALHEGHMSLVRQARQDCEFVVVTIFVNPAQFGPSEDLDRYPRDLDRDMELCQEAGVDVVFAPSARQMYPEGYDTYVEVGRLGDGLCGASRPGHFRGVATVVLKLFNITLPTRAYFGQKDYQQLAIIRQMTRDFDLPIEIVGMPIVREPDGLAMSSRNKYLSPEERRAALVLHRSLGLASEMWRRGQREPYALRDVISEAITSNAVARVDYVEVADPVTLKQLTEPQPSVLIAVAAFFGSTRLIDNTVLGDRP